MCVQNGVSRCGIAHAGDVGDAGEGWTPQHTLMGRVLVVKERFSHLCEVVLYHMGRPTNDASALATVSRAISTAHMP